MVGGDGGAFEVVQGFVAEGGYARAVATVRAVCGTRVDAEDAVQDALARALATSGIRSLGPWVAVTAINNVRQDSRRVARRSATVLPEPDGSVERDLELRDVVLAAIATLSPRQRDVVVLRYYWDLPIAEIAALLCVSTGTVKLQLHRARGHVRSSLAQVVEVDA